MWPKCGLKHGQNVAKMWLNMAKMWLKHGQNIAKTRQICGQNVVKNMAKMLLKHG